MLRLKDWMKDKIASEMHGGYLDEVLGIEKETEKAYLLVMDWEYSSNTFKRITHWVPKSAVLTEEQFEAEEKAHKEQQNKGLEYNALLLTFAKVNNVKGVRKGMKSITLINKIKEAGLEVPAK